MVRTLEVLLEQRPSGRLLEIGTSGIVPVALSTLAPSLEVEATHRSDLPVVSDLVCSLRGGSREIRVFNVDLESDAIPVPDGHYDVVLCCEVLEHMERDPMAMMSEVNRVLRDGGLLVLTTPNANSSRSIEKALTGREPYFYMQYRRSGEADRHNYEYSVRTLVRVVSAAGFPSPSVWTEDSFEVPAPDVIRRVRSAGFDVRDHGDNIFCVARRASGVVDRYPEPPYSD
jgi:SAM-dependent methyltransferase